MYAMLGTRPDLAFAVGVLGRFASNPDDLHWAAVEHFLRYIKGTLDHGLQYNPEDSPVVGLEAYSDSDWGADVDTSRSTMGYTFLVAGGAVSWSSRIQPRIMASSTEAEYLSLSHSSEAIVLRQLLEELGHPQASPSVLFGDNQGANVLSHDPQFNNRTHHLRLTEHLVRETVEQGLVRVKYISTARMVADIFTNLLPVPAFSAHRDSLGVRALVTRGG